jgi:cytochrome c553
MKFSVWLAALVLAGVWTARADEKVEKGKELVEAKKCSMCHYTTEVKEKKKPMAVGDKSAEWVVKLLKKEEKLSDGKPHPAAMKLTDEELDAIAAFVKTLK